MLKSSVQDKINEQINNEFYSSYSYLAMAAFCEHEQSALIRRKNEIEDSLAGFDAELDLCFESEKDDLARGLVRKKLEAERILKHLASKHAANEQHLEKQRKLLDENSATLESLRQKADLLAQRNPDRDGLDFDDVAWMARDMRVSDDEIEIALLSEKSRRSAS